MTPGAFDPITAREITGDAMARAIEAKARQDEDSEKFDPPAVDGETYWGQVQQEMRAAVYREQYKKRIARNTRKASGEMQDLRGRKGGAQRECRT
jgi:hypothetical protein